MFYISITEVFLNNSNLLATRISCLSNAHKNSLYLIALIYVSLAPLTPKTRNYLILLTCLFAKSGVVPGLTNTLFSIHPPLLYICSFLGIYYTAKCCRYKAILPLFSMILSMALGGLWSMQELSWGGWWNWDVLECGIAYICLIILFFSHSKQRSVVSVSFSNAINVAAVIYTYNILNKCGLATSIHSFVTSKSIKNHYLSITLLHFTLFLVLVKYNLIKGVILCLVIYVSYLNLRWCIFLKKPLVLALVVAEFTLFRKKHIFKITHFIILSSFLLIFLVNFYNISFLKNCRVELRSSQFYGYEPLLKLDFFSTQHTPIIWNNLFLSKPRFSYSLYFTSFSTRNINGRFNQLVFFK